MMRDDKMAADILIQFYYQLTNINLDTKHFKKYRARKLLKKAKKSMILEVNKSLYTAFDIIDFLSLLESAKTIYNYQFDIPFKYNYSSGMFAESSIWPIIGSIDISIGNDDDRIDTSIKAHIDNEFDKQGSIEFKWNLHKENKDNIIEKRFTKLVEANGENKKIIDESDILENMTFYILQNAFRIVVESICDHIKEMEHL